MKVTWIKLEICLISWIKAQSFAYDIVHSYIKIYSYIYIVMQSTFSRTSKKYVHDQGICPGICYESHTQLLRGNASYML